MTRIAIIFVEDSREFTDAKVLYRNGDFGDPDVVRELERLLPGWGTARALEEKLRELGFSDPYDWVCQLRPTQILDWLVTEIDKAVWVIERNNKVVAMFRTRLEYGGW